MALDDSNVIRTTGDHDLPAVSIFDARSANIHVENTNAVAYIPQPMQVLETLANACDRVKAKLDAQVKALDAQTPLALKASKLSTETAAGAFVHNLSAKSNLTQLSLLATLSAEERQRLSSLETDLAQDPKRAAARIANQKVRLDEQVATLKRLGEAASASAFIAREKLKAERGAKAEAAKLASDTLFAASPLPEIGHATWRSLGKLRGNTRMKSRIRNWPSFELPLSGPGPVVNKLRRRQLLDADGRPLPAANAPLAGNPLRLVRDYANPIPKLEAAASTCRRAEPRVRHTGARRKHCGRTGSRSGCLPGSCAPDSPS
jgi:hypothetical protein